MTAIARPDLARVIRGFLSRDERKFLLAHALASRRWESGRQGTGYLRSAANEPFDTTFLPFVMRSLTELHAGPSDAWLLRYPSNSSIPEHIDPPIVDGSCHERLNAIIRSDSISIFKLDGLKVVLSAGDALVFRPDLQRHEVTRVAGGERFVWSVGVNYREEKSSCPRS